MLKFFDNHKSMVLFFLIYAPLGAICPLIGQYLSSIGFSGTQVGIVTSVGTGAAVVAGLFWGRTYANAKGKRLVIAIMFLGAAISTVTGSFIRNFFWFTAIYGAIYFFQGPVHGLCDSMVIANRENYPPIRALGAIGYAVSCYFAGLVAERVGLGSIFYLHAIGFILAAFVLKTEPEPPHFTEKSEKVSMTELFKDKKFIKLLICAFFILGTTMANNTYFGYLYKEAGGSVSGIGLAILLMAGSEAIFMFLLPVLNRYIMTEKLIVIGIAIAVLRFGLYAAGPSTGVLLGTFFLQGMMNGILLVEFVKYFEKIVEPKLAAISVSTYYALGNNLSAIVCNFISGVVLDGFGAQGVYVFFALFNLTGLILYIALGLTRSADSEVDSYKEV